MKIMQGAINIPLNETGRAQAEEVRDKLKGISFDAVIASPMDRAVETASIITGLSKDDIIKDKRIREFGFGKFENVEYSKMGPAMTLYWVLPELFPVPKQSRLFPLPPKG